MTFFVREFSIIAVILILIAQFAFASCSGVSTPGGSGAPDNPEGNNTEGGAGGGGISGGGSGISGDGGGIGEESGSGGVTNSDDGSGGGSAPGGDDSAVSGAQASIPMQAIKPPNANKIIVAASDSQSNVPVVGSDGAVDPEYRNGDYQVLVSNTPIDNTSSFSQNHNPSQPPLILRGGVNLPPLNLRGGRGSYFPLFSQALAQVELPDNIEFPNGEEPSICDRVGVSCCDINADGSFECFHEAAGNANTQYVYLTDGRRVSDDPMVEPPNTDVLYLSEAPKDVVVGPSGRIMSVAGDNGVMIGTGNDGNLAVGGAFDEGYRAFDGTGVEELAFEPTATQISLRNPGANVLTAAVGELLPDIALVDLDPVADIRREAIVNTRSFTVLKRSGDGKLRFGREVETPTDLEFIRSALDPDGDRINFLQSDKDANGVGIKSSKTISFDVDPLNTALVVFQDEAGKNRIRMAAVPAINIPLRLGGETALEGSFDFKDLVIYQPQNGGVRGVNDGRALIVDAANSVVWTISYFVDRTVPRTEHFIQSTLNLATDAIPVGSKPQSVALRADGSKAYVVNQDDATVTEITLKSGEVPLTVAAINEPANGNKRTINLRDSIPGKELTIRPNQVTLDSSGENLIVGTEGLRSALVVPVNP